MTFTFPTGNTVYGKVQNTGSDASISFFRCQLHYRYDVTKYRWQDTSLTRWKNRNIVVDNCIQLAIISLVLFHSIIIPRIISSFPVVNDYEENAQRKLHILAMLMLSDKLITSTRLKSVHVWLLL